MLQGSLDNFALDEVLGLLSSTSKTGQLDIKGDRGSGSLVFNQGDLVDAASSFTANGGDIEDVMFELLRYSEGTFNFTNRQVEAGERTEHVASVLSAAENRLSDWRQIEAVVPTLDHMVTPAPDLPDDDVTINRSEWAVLTVIAAGCPASTVCERLSMGEVEGSRQIKNLAERLLVNVGPPRSAAIAGGAARTPSAVPSVVPPRPVQAPPAVPDAYKVATTSGDVDPFLASEPVSATPPSPSEISEFSERVDDASELTGEHDVTSGNGLLMKYLQNEG